MEFKSEEVWACQASSGGFGGSSSTLWFPLLRWLNMGKDGQKNLARIYRPFLEDKRDIPCLSFPPGFRNVIRTGSIHHNQPAPPLTTNCPRSTRVDTRHPTTSVVGPLRLDSTVCSCVPARFSVVGPVCVSASLGSPAHFFLSGSSKMPSASNRLRASSRAQVCILWMGKHVSIGGPRLNKMTMNTTVSHKYPVKHRHRTGTIIKSLVSASRVFNEDFPTATHRHRLPLSFPGIVIISK